MSEEKQPAPPIRAHDYPQNYCSRRLQKWGFSLGVTLPRPYLRALSWALHTEVKLILIGGGIFIQRRGPDMNAPGVVAVAGAAPKDT